MRNVLKVQLPAALLVAMSVVATSELARAEEKPELVSVKRIWDRGRWNGTTDLIRFKDRWWVSFREANGHAGGQGIARIIVSDDGEQWKSAVEFHERGLDLRDPAGSS